jgi:hypothetical protein
MQVVKQSKLFEAGHYPDKGVTVSESDLDRMVSRFSPVPIKVEHMDTPFDGALGTVSKIWRKGIELFGDLAFNPHAWALAEAAGAKLLSIGLKRDLSGLSEVSLVRIPRVADARVFHFSRESDAVLTSSSTDAAAAACFRASVNLEAFQAANGPMCQKLRIDESALLKHSREEALEAGRIYAKAHPELSWKPATFAKFDLQEACQRNHINYEVAKLLTDYYRAKYNIIAEDIFNNGGTDWFKTACRAVNILDSRQPMA